MAEINAVMREHRVRLERAIRVHGVAPLKKMYAQAMRQLEGRLAALVRRGDGDTFTAHMQRSMMAQVKDAQIRLSAKMANQLGEGVRDIQAEQLKAIVRDVTRLEKRYTGASVTIPVEQGAKFTAVVDRHRKTLLRAHKTSMTRYGARVIAAMEEQTGMGLVTGLTNHKVADAIMETMDGEFWQAERIARTESMYGANLASRDGIEAASDVVPGLMMQWREYISDSGVSLDSRVADGTTDSKGHKKSADSSAMHLQVVEPGGAFVMPGSDPDGRPTPAQMAGRSWLAPPNRPHDRASTAPWKADWGIPGWRWAGRRVWLVE